MIRNSDDTILIRIGDSIQGGNIYTNLPKYITYSYTKKIMAQIYYAHMSLP